MSHPLDPHLPPHFIILGYTRTDLFCAPILGQSCETAIVLAIEVPAAITLGVGWAAEAGSFDDLVDCQFRYLKMGGNGCKITSSTR
jgi:hypothetical protein